MSRVSHRVWSKGSGRKTGAAEGSVRLPDQTTVQSHSGVPSCGCGARMKACEACSDAYCDAPGHAAHLCGGTP